MQAEKHTAAASAGPAAYPKEACRLFASAGLQNDCAGHCKTLLFHGRRPQPLLCVLLIRPMLPGAGSVRMLSTCLSNVSVTVVSSELLFTWMQPCRSPGLRSEPACIRAGGWRLPIRIPAERGTPPPAWPRHTGFPPWSNRLLQICLSPADKSAPFIHLFRQRTRKLIVNEAAGFPGIDHSVLPGAVGPKTKCAAGQNSRWQTG